MRAAAGTEKELRDWPGEAIFEATCGTGEAGLGIRSFQEVILLTANGGLVFSSPGGPEFQLTIVCSR